MAIKEITDFKETSWYQMAEAIDVFEAKYWVGLPVWTLSNDRWPMRTRIESCELVGMSNSKWEWHYRVKGSPELIAEHDLFEDTTEFIESLHERAKNVKFIYVFDSPSTKDEEPIKQTSQPDPISQEEKVSFWLKDWSFQYWQIALLSLLFVLMGFVLALGVGVRI